MKIERKCVSCGHNIRTQNGECHCDLDNRYIGYIQCFEHWCKHWKRDRKWDKKYVNSR
jgi:hypothetical protein